MTSIPKKILIIGYSSFVQRRVIQSLKKIKNIKIFISSKSHKIDNNKKIFFNDYEQALKTKKFDYVYISLINNLHFHYAKMALNLGYNVIVDKPITTSFSETNQLLKIARAKKLLLCELIIFNQHAVFNKISNIIGGNKKIEAIHANFNVPVVGSLKHISNIHGDCKYNMGPYAASIIRIFFNGKFKENLVIKNHFNKPFNKTNKEFSVLIKDKSKIFFGNFGIGKEYLSNLIFFGNQKIIKIPFQAFALPCNKNINLIIKNKNRKYTVKLKDDYIKRVFEDIINSKYNLTHYYNKIDMDNRIKKKLKLI